MQSQTTEVLSFKVKLLYGLLEADATGAVAICAAVAVCLAVVSRYRWMP